MTIGEADKEFSGIMALIQEVQRICQQYGISIGYENPYSYITGQVRVEQSPPTNQQRFDYLPCVRSRQATASTKRAETRWGNRPPPKTWFLGSTRVCPKHLDRFIPYCIGRGRKQHICRLQTMPRCLLQYPASVLFACDWAKRFRVYAAISGGSRNIIEFASASECGLLLPPGQTAL